MPYGVVETEDDRKLCYNDIDEVLLFPAAVDVQRETVDNVPLLVVQPIVHEKNPSR